MEVTESGNILVVVAIGRRTHLTPLLEICRVLHASGHRITIAGMEGQLYNLPDYVQETIVVCKPMDPLKDTAIHHSIDEAVVTTRHGRKTLASGLMFFDSFYPEIYQNLKPIIASRSGKEKVDFILADFFEIAAIDLALEFNVPYAVCQPQISFPLGRAAYVPGLPGQQQHILTSEHASLSQRVYETWMALVFLVDMLPWFKARMAMRKKYSKAKVQDRAHLHLVNSFWGFETPLMMSPLVCAIGPLCADTWSPLTPEVSKFLVGRSRVVYVAFGTLTSLTPTRYSKLRDTLQTLLDNGQVDGVIWSLKKIPEYIGSEKDEFGKRNDILVLPWLPQRAILASESIKLFITHSGTASVFESMIAGVPMLCMPLHGDQMAVSLRCISTGIGLRLNKHEFTTVEAVQKASTILEDRDGAFKTNCLRMQRIARMRSKIGPQEAAAKIQEVLYDHEMRLMGKEMRPPHLELPSERMGFWKRHNLDLYTLGPFVGLYMGLKGTVKSLF